MLLRNAAQERLQAPAALAQQLLPPAKPKAPAQFVSSHELQLSGPAVMLAEHLTVVQLISGPFTGALVLKRTAKSKDELKPE